MRVQVTDTLMMVRPSHFGFNRQTALSNSFQQVPAFDPQPAALREFSSVVDRLRSEQIRVFVYPDDPSADTPDAIFPNNWVSFHENHTVVLYPMEAPARRRERRVDLVEQLCEATGVTQPVVVDLTKYEATGKFLEGTGSVVFDHTGKRAYCALSSRSHREPLEELGQTLGYSLLPFHTCDFSGLPVYHTNVMLTIGNQLAIVCTDVVTEPSERSRLIENLESGQRTVVTISGNQLLSFAGNMLEVRNARNEPYFLLSETALRSLHSSQKRTLEATATLLPVNIPTIERTGGGSIRCMVAEVFLAEEHPTGEVVIRSPENAKEWNLYFSLRWKVLRAPWGQPLGSERDDQEETSLHFMALLNGTRTVGTGRLQEIGPGTAQLRYMAVDPDFHGKGIGKKLIESMESAARRKNWNRIFLQARELAVPFYQSCGYRVIEKTFLLFGQIQHYSMEKEI